MANSKLFTLNLTASQTYTFTNDASANGGVLVNDAGSTGSITIEGTAKITINGSLVSSQPIALNAGQYIVFGNVTPLEFEIKTDAATTGKLMLSV